ncbi:Protein kinase-like domain [Pseudocohnilembus persalinus]|uniref:Protein kinase-like domain n=1 Tax=Pseudocohnilembus persalinus TaxID=266149 RepID=A0A0V0QEX7_PSEPJ|nr:Protein kinase-like domain [Pseudocohnilembus persalinus]|eukprot:KRX00696.1 Protein kinase-like domain [Pseudocohnilembus persalinus]
MANTYFLLNISLNQIVLYRYFLRLVFRLGEFSVDPFTGQLLFKLSFNQDFYNTENSKFNYDIFFKLVRLAFSTTYYAIDIHLLRILVLSNIITQKQYDQFKKISNYINDKSILYFREISHEASELMKNIIRYLGYMKNNRSLICNVTEELKKLKEMTQIPKGSNQGEGISTLKQWDDFKLQKQDEIGEGGFAKIYRVQGVTDFGESQSLDSIKKAQNEQQNISPAYTLPFASPERFTDEKGYSIDHQSDIFSFGAIISEIIFQKNLLDCKKWNHKIIVKKLQKLQYKILLSNFNIDQAGSKHVLQIIKLIMLLCVHPDKKERPQIEWIIIIFKQLISYLEQLY